MQQPQWYDIYELDHQSVLARPIPGWLGVLVLGLFVLGIAALLVYVLWWSKPERIWQRALNRLSSLSSNDQKELTAQALTITREYLIQRFAITQKGLTDLEVLSYLHHTNDISYKMIAEDLKKLNEIAYMVKFSNSIPFEIEPDDIKRRCATIIRQTIPTDHMQ